MFEGKHNGYAELSKHAMKIGYARVSTQEQSRVLQLDALRQAGCRQVYEEVISGGACSKCGDGLRLMSHCAWS